MIVNTLQRCSSILVLLLLLGSAPVCLAQDTVYARKIVRDLTADEFHGRGYYKGGDSKAADYIAKEFRKLKLQKIHGSYFQNFSLAVNVFPAKVELTIGGQKLTPGEDFIVSPACPPVKGKYGILRMERPYGSFYKMDLSKDFLLIDRTNADSTTKAELDSIIKNPPPAAGLLIPEPKKLTWSVARKVNPYAGIRVLADSFPSTAHDLEVEVNSKFIKKYNTQNVIAMIPGTTQPDSFIVFTAHYDHIGRMGRNTIFPGANDNASGVSMVLALAKHYADSANRTGKSLVFILFAAEEAGLVGSEYFVNHPLIPLDKIRFLINMDMMGTGEDGVMVVNGEVHEQEYNILKEANDKNGWLKEVGKRGTAKNSDHHFFSERGVPAFFFYTTGGSKAYHDIYDTHEKLSFAGYSGVFHLITSFVDRVGN